MFAEKIVEIYSIRLCQQHVVIAASITSRTCLHIVYIKAERIKVRRNVTSVFIRIWHLQPVTRCLAMPDYLPSLTYGFKVLISSVLYMKQPVLWAIG